MNTHKPRTRSTFVAKTVAALSLLLAALLALLNTAGPAAISANGIWHI